MKSFLQGKKSLSIPPLRPTVTGLRAAHAVPAQPPRASAPAAVSHGQPTVEVVKEGDKVVRLIVVCSCGERVEIECLYPVGN